MRGSPLIQDDVPVTEPASARYMPEDEHIARVLSREGVDPLSAATDLTDKGVQRQDDGLTPFNLPDVPRSEGPAESPDINRSSPDQARRAEYDLTNRDTPPLDHDYQLPDNRTQPTLPEYDLASHQVTPPDQAPPATELAGRDAGRGPDRTDYPDVPIGGGPDASGYDLGQAGVSPGSPVVPDYGLSDAGQSERPDRADYQLPDDRSQPTVPQYDTRVDLREPEQPGYDLPDDRSQPEVPQYDTRVDIQPPEVPQYDTRVDLTQPGDPPLKVPQTMESVPRPRPPEAMEYTPEYRNVEGVPFIDPQQVNWRGGPETSNTRWM